MHQAYLRVVDVEMCLRLLKIVGEGIEQGVLVVAVPGVQHQARGLVNNQHILILIDHLERNVLWLNSKVYRLVVEHDLYEVKRLDFVVARHGLLVHKDISRLCSLLDTVTARTRHVLAQVLIHADGCLPPVHCATISLKTTHHPTRYYGL